MRTVGILFTKNYRHLLKCNGGMGKVQIQEGNASMGVLIEITN